MLSKLSACGFLDNQKHCDAAVQMERNLCDHLANIGFICKKDTGSCNSQLVKKNLTAIHFHAETSRESEIKALGEAVGISTSASEDWTPRDAPTSPLGQHVIDRVRHYCRLRGIKSISEQLVASFAERMVSTQRSFGHRSANRIVSTIHGAKNREFENVFVLWNLL